MAYETKRSFVNVGMPRRRARGGGLRAAIAARPMAFLLVALAGEFGGAASALALLKPLGDFGFLIACFLGACLGLFGAAALYVWALCSTHA